MSGVFSARSIVARSIAVVLLIALLAHFARVALVVFGLNPTPDTAYIVEALADQAIVLSISLLLIGPLIVMAYPSLRCCRLLGECQGCQVLSSQNHQAHVLHVAVGCSVSVQQQLQRGLES